MDDETGQGADICPAMTTDLGLVPDTSESNAVELPTHCRGDRSPQGRLADLSFKDENECACE